MNPYAILAAVGVSIGLAIGAFLYGEHVDNLAWTAKEQRLIAENIQKAREAENAQAAKAAEIEGKYLDADKRATDLAGQLTTAVSHGVRLAGACKPRVPQTSAAPGSASPDAATDGVLPAEIGRNLVSLARDAERTLAVARAGQQYAIGAP